MNYMFYKKDKTKAADLYTGTLIWVTILGFLFFLFSFYMHFLYDTNVTILASIEFLFCWMKSNNLFSPFFYYKLPN